MRTKFMRSKNWGLAKNKISAQSINVTTLASSSILFFSFLKHDQIYYDSVFWTNAKKKRLFSWDKILIKLNSKRCKIAFSLTHLQKCIPLNLGISDNSSLFKREMHVKINLWELKLKWSYTSSYANFLYAN